jgi:uncharacterized repeat protein (TIGR03803 family)
LPGAGFAARKEVLMNIRKNTLPGCIVLLAILSLAVGSIAAAQNPAQNVVPPTAVQAAKMPQFASHLAHRAGPQASAKTTGTRPQLSSCSEKHPGNRYRTARDSKLSPDQWEWSYDNGPSNGNNDAWTINFGYIVSDSFNVSNGSATVTGMSFAAWMFPGDVLSTAEVSITSSENGGTSYFDQTVSFTQGTCTGNDYGYYICTETTSFNGPTLNAGTYWVNLQNASVPSGDPVYWDENSGVGCGGAGCPSSASESELGTIPSESFTILGTSSTTTTTTSSRGNDCMPEQYGYFSVIHDFNGTDGSSPSGVAIDRAGNLYGAANTSNGNGTIYKLAQAADWALSTLYNFIGGASGSDPQGVIVGPNDNLYGAAEGGLQNCNSGYCGFIFGLRPSPTACITASCSWMENAVYSFTGPTDAQQGNGLVSDKTGNLYGVSASGGTQQQGAVFELQPTIGGWTESILYSFQGGAGGGYPVDLIVGNDGNLYGMAAGGGTGGGGVVFQLTPSGSSWTESVLYDIPNDSYMGSNPHSLLQDTEGNLFGIYEYSPCCADIDGLIFMLTPSNGQWVFTELHHGNEDLDGDDVFPNMTLDTSGDLWGTGTASNGCENTEDYAYIFELQRVNNNWQYFTHAFWNYTYWRPSGALAMDTQGYLYGTTSWCGAHGQGAVWKFSW